MKTNEFLKKQHKEPHVIRNGKKHKPTIPKSSHKHAYEDCLITYTEEHPIYSNNAVERCYRAQYCTICGKIGDTHLFETEKVQQTLPNGHTITESRLLLRLTVKEMQERYPNLKTFTVNNKWKDKFVKIE